MEPVAREIPVVHRGSRRSQEELGGFFDAEATEDAGPARSFSERQLLASAGFRLQKTFPTAAQFAVIEAFPVWSEHTFPNDYWSRRASRILS